jgi:CCR4-NOT transcription complex subunit 9
MDDSDVVNFLLQTEIIPLCLRIMESGSELSKTVATFIVQKILLDDVGLAYVCHTADRFFAVSTVLANMIAVLVDNPSHRLLKHIIRCYLRLADNAKAREALRQVLPPALQEAATSGGGAAAATFADTLKNDPGATKWLSQLIRAVFPEQANARMGGH